MNDESGTRPATAVARNGTDTRLAGGSGDRSWNGSASGGSSSSADSDGASNTNASNPNASSGNGGTFEGLRDSARRGGRHAWVDASAGVAGDMLLGALLDAGASLTNVQSAVDAVSGGTVRVSIREVRRGGLRALKAEVEPLVAGPAHRTWRNVRELLERAGPVARSATAVFQRLAEAEARVHGIPPEEVHFHEVGALDAIADVVGCCAALADLGIDTVSAGPIALGSGTVRSQHGRLPVPAPAVAELAKGWQVSAGISGGESATPTGMALLRTFARTCEPLPAMVLESVGVGAGTRDPAGHANVVRVLIGTTDAPSEQLAQEVRTTCSDAPAADPVDGGVGDSAARFEANVTAGGSAPLLGTGCAAGEPALLLEANVDDLDPRLWPGILAGLLRSGASDAWLVPIVMKKGRPAHTLSVLCSPAVAGALRDQIFRHTSTLGVRDSPRGKVALRRAFTDVTVDDTRIAVKIGYSDGIVLQVMPEFDDVAALARRSGRPERLVLQDALTAAAAAGLIVGIDVPTGLRPG